MKQKSLLGFLHSLVLIFLLLPFFQEQTNWVTLKPLGGYLPKVEKPSWNTKSWFKEELQKGIQSFTNYNMGFRSLMIRIYNQLDFNLFAIPHASEVVIGKNNYLFENNYIKDYIGKAFVGEEVSDERMARLRLIQEYLKQKNIDLVVVLNPGKATYYPQYIPDRFHPEKRTISNYLYWARNCKTIGINTIDFSQYLIKLKDTVSWPLYPKCGIHWSVYGMAFCADSLFHYIEKTRGIILPDFGWNGVDVPDTLRDTDNDIGEGMNLLVNINTPKGAYPHFYFKDRPGMTKPDILVISDSFYWTIFGSAISFRMFNKNSYWYYFEQAFDNTRSEVDVKSLDVKKEIEAHQMVFLMSSEPNLYRFPYGFLERVYPLYFPQDTAGQYQAFRKLIKWDKSWFNKVKADARLHHQEIEAAVDAEAKITMLYKDSLVMTENDYKHFIKSITSNPEWEPLERQKAKDRHQSYEQVLREDARWLFSTQLKNYRRKYWPAFNNQSSGS